MALELVDAASSIFPTSPRRLPPLLRTLHNQGWVNHEAIKARVSGPLTSISPIMC